MTLVMRYDDTDKRDKGLDFWTTRDTRYNTTENAADGRRTLKAIQRLVAEETRKRRMVCTRRAGVPDAAVFGKGDTMAGHLAGLTWAVVVECRGLAEMTRRRNCWTDPDTVRACVITMLA